MLSHRAGAILLVILAIAAYHIWISGKLGRAWAALNGAGSSGGGSSGPTPGSVAGSIGGAFGGGSGDYAQGFGINAALSGQGTSLPGVSAQDQAGLNAYGGSHPLAGDYDYAAALGTPVSLPGGASQRYTYLGNTISSGLWGNLLSFSTPGGGVINLPHLANLANLVPGQTYTGGTYVGQVGNPYGTTAPSPATPDWTGPHLAVIIDQAARSFLASIGLTP